jgi:hypothetical protein
MYAVGADSAAAGTLAAGPIGTVGIAEGVRGAAGGTGTLTAACVVAGGLAIRPIAPAPGASVPISVSSGDIGAGDFDADANVVPGLGKADTGTLFNALQNASALWNRSAGSLAMAIRIISFKAGGTSARKLIGEGGC